MSRLRAHLLQPQVDPFRQRNPRTAAALTSPYAPAIGASLAGIALGIYPSQQMRVTIAIFAMFRALEFGWNMCEQEGLIWGIKGGKKIERPWWFGSWILQPFAFGQLLHAAVFDRDCFPEVSGLLPSKLSPALTGPLTIHRHMATSSLKTQMAIFTPDRRTGLATSNGLRPPT